MQHIGTLWSLKLGVSAEQALLSTKFAYRNFEKCSTLQLPGFWTDRCSRSRIHLKCTWLQDPYALMCKKTSWECPSELGCTAAMLTGWNSHHETDGTFTNTNCPARAFAACRKDSLLNVKKPATASTVIQRVLYGNSRKEWHQSYICWPEHAWFQASAVLFSMDWCLCSKS